MLGRDFNSDANNNVEIDLSSMIDCIFILLIFFIVTTVFVDEVGTEVNKPDLSSSSVSTLDSNSVVIRISADNKVTCGGETIGVQGVGPLIKPKLDVDPETSVVIQGDPEASHGIVQRVHAAARLAGAKRPSISITNQ